MRSSTRRGTFQVNQEPLFHSLRQKIEGPSIINLIEFKRDQLVLNEEALLTLRNIKEDLIIVFIFGKENSGKSYLMNLLINSKEKNKIKVSNSLITRKSTKAFKLNSYFNLISGNKKGIYFWSSPLEKENSKEKILFFDSVGLNNESTDNIIQQRFSKLLALMIVISSLFIYNTVGDINSRSLNALQLIVQLTDSINIEGKIDKDDFISELCPKFIWTLRDFNLDKYNEIKNDCDSYLEKCLHDDRFKGKNNDEINMINESLVKYFKKRECIAMPCPASNQKELALLNQMNFEELNDDFQNEFNVLKNKVYVQSKAKKINGKKINGQILVKLLKLFIKDINNENVPNLDKIFINLIKNDLDSSYNKAMNEFRNKLEKLKREEDIDIKEIYHIKYESIKEYMNILETNPEIYNKQNYLKEYEIIKEKLVQELDKEIKSALDMLIPDYSYDRVLQEKKDVKYNNINEITEDYLDTLINFKMDMTDAILNKKDFDVFIKNDIEKTSDIINYIKNDKNEITITKENEEEINTNKNINDINNIQLELDNAKKEELELIEKYKQSLEKRDEYLRNKFSTFRRPSLKTYSNKLLGLYFPEEKACELNEKEKEEERCGCNLGGTFKNCAVF